MTVLDDDSPTGRATPHPGSGRSETPEQRSDRNWNELLQELRVMQTGVQILTGFLLTLPFQPRFWELERYQHVWYLVLVVLAVLTTGLAIAPVATHRALFRKHMKPDLVTTADRMTRAALLCLALVTTGAIGLVFDVVLSLAAGVWTSAITLVGLVGLWAAWPALIRARSGRT